VIAAAIWQSTPSGTRLLSRSPLCPIATPDATCRTLDSVCRSAPPAASVWTRRDAGFFDAAPRAAPQRRARRPPARALAARDCQRPAPAAAVSAVTARGGVGSRRPPAAVPCTAAGSSRRRRRGRSGGGACQQPGRRRGGGRWSHRRAAAPVQTFFFFCTHAGEAAAVAAVPRQPTAPPRAGGGRARRAAAAPCTPRDACARVAGVAARGDAGRPRAPPVRRPRGRHGVDRAGARLPPRVGLGVAARRVGAQRRQ